MKIYALAIEGRMFYFAGEIPSEQYSAVNKIANSIIHYEEDHSYEQYLTSFVNRVYEELHLELAQQKIKYVFRKR